VSLRVTMPGRISRKYILGLRGIYTWTLGDVAPPNGSWCWRLSPYQFIEKPSIQRVNKMTANQRYRW